VDLIDAVDVQSLAGGSDVPRRPHVATTASATITTSFPFTSAATIRGPITPTTTGQVSCVRSKALLRLDRQLGVQHVVRPTGRDDEHALRVTLVGAVAYAALDL